MSLIITDTINIYFLHHVSWSMLNLAVYKIHDVINIVINTRTNYIFS
jgi:hypothetical protein